jgi:diaminohydroxyphosphoribosylaminopyrimidine deaminase / 5-amino-6-(5-phosphoribosylamino)uracil reductase
MKRCLKLAEMGFGNVAPNPMVGCVIVNNGKVIGEGYHEKYGESHAEINAINSVKNKALLKYSVLYVSLEPCAHYGKTPPCADAIIKHGIKKVIIGSIDTNPLVRGKGIAKLMQNGCEIITGVLEDECLELNKRFFTFYREKRPYTILKWAMTKDGYIDKIRTKNDKPLKVTGIKADKLSHKWRSEEQAIMVGTNTMIMDNPSLTTRNVKGRSPIIVALDKDLKISPDSKIFSTFASVMLLNAKKNAQVNNVEFIKVKFKEHNLDAMLIELYKRNIQSILVEGGAKLLNSFISQGLWDEARVFTANKLKIGDGIKAPGFKGSFILNKKNTGNDTLNVYIKKPAVIS